jgi:hypothetical protein
MRCSAALLLANPEQRVRFATLRSRGVV